MRRCTYGKDYTMSQLNPQTTISYTWMESPVGRLLLAADDAALCAITFANGRTPAKPDPAWREDAEQAIIVETIRQLRGWFGGERRHFDLPLAPAGPAFHQRVWRELC